MVIIVIMVQKTHMINIVDICNKVEQGSFSHHGLQSQQYYQGQYNHCVNRINNGHGHIGHMANKEANMDKIWVTIWQKYNKTSWG